MMSHRTFDSSPHRLMVRNAVVAVLLFLIPTALRAATLTWIGPATGGSWTDVNNWTDGVTTGDYPDVSGDDAVVDGNALQNTTLTYSLTGATNIGSLSIGAGDTLTINKSGSPTTSASMTINGALSNSGNLTFGGSSAVDSHGNVFSVTITTGGGTFNTSTGTLTLDSLTGFRRANATFQLPASNANDGTVYLRNRSSQGGGKVRLMLTGAGAQTFTNNGSMLVEGRGGDPTGANTPSALIGPGTANQALTLGGTGTLTLASRLSNRTDSYAMLTGLAGGTSLVNSATHTIEGNGYIGSTTPNSGSSGNTVSLSLFTSVTNQGLIRAAPSVGSNWAAPLLFISSPLVNSMGGRILATGGAGVNINGASFLNDGRIEARSTGSIEIGAATTATINGDVRGAGTFIATNLMLSGSATLTPGDSANTDGTGNSTAGNLSVTGNLLLANATTLDFQLGSDNVAGTDYDSLFVSQSFTLDGVLNVTDLPGFDAGIYRLFTFNVGGLTDNGLSFGSMPSGFSYNLDINNGGGYVDLLVTVPEPTATLMILAGLAALITSQRRRQQAI